MKARCALAFLAFSLVASSFGPANAFKRSPWDGSWLKHNLEEAQRHYNEFTASKAGKTKFQLNQLVLVHNADGTTSKGRLIDWDSDGEQWIVFTGPDANYERVGYSESQGTSIADDALEPFAGADWYGSENFSCSRGSYNWILIPPKLAQSKPGYRAPSYISASIRGPGLDEDTCLYRLDFDWTNTKRPWDRSDRIGQGGYVLVSKSQEQEALDWIQHNRN